MSSSKYNVTGNTYEFKAKIKKAGGKWNPAFNCWNVELYKSDSLWAYESRGLVFALASSEKSKLEISKDYNSLINEGGEGYTHNF